MASFTDIVQSAPAVLVDFHATWCGPCKTMAPILKEIKSVLGENVKVIKIDIDKNQSLAQKLGVQAVPTLLLYHEGKQVWRQSGVIPAHVLEQKLRSLV